MAITFQDAKGAGDTLDHVVSWAPILAGDTITASAWVIPAGLTQTGESFAATTTTVWLGGGVAGQTYGLKNTITTSGGRTIQRTIDLKVEEM